MKDSSSTPAPLAPVAVAAGYQVKIGRVVHVVNKNRQCSCRRPDCPAINQVQAYLASTSAPAASKPNTFACPVCGAEASGSLENKRWKCSADPRHPWAWWAERIRQARESALSQADPYTRDLHRFFASNERAAFLDAHRLSYPAQG